MSDMDDPIFELRFYNLAEGRDADMRRRVREDLAWLFPRHGIRPLAGWSALAAPALPMFIYLTPWRNMVERNCCWAGFYADPAWQEVRNRTNAGSELVTDYEIFFLRGMSPWRALASDGGELDEVVIQRTLVGKGLASAAALRERELPALEQAGAQVQGAFDVLSGCRLPAAISVLRWRDWDARRGAREAVDANPAIVAARAEERRQFGAELLGTRSSFLVAPVPVDWQ
ncbi:MAG: NIPSNAP family protein [Porticoccaceae bacterium]